jgi:hypothetical protein
MIGPPPGTRVYLACGVTDMRRYVEYTIMQSPRRRISTRRGFLVRLSPHNAACVRQ